MLHKRHSLRDFKRKVSPPQPSFMTDDQKSDYLSKLRADRPARPSGSRPPPFKTPTYPSSPSRNVPSRDKALHDEQRPQVHFDDSLQASRVDDPHVRDRSPGLSTSSARSRTNVGRPLVSEPTSHSSNAVRGRQVSSTTSVQSPSQDEAVPYRESGSRWMERQEAMSLRDALEVMDQQDDEKKIHEAAQDEAADLVWRHQNPAAAEKEISAPFRNPDMPPKHRFRAHLEKGAHARSQSLASAESRRGLPNSNSYKSISDTLTASNNGKNVDTVRGSTGSAGSIGAVSDRPHGNSEAATFPTGQMSNIATGIEKLSVGRRRSSGPRVVSSGSSKGVFRNPEDQIFEEPEEVVTATTTSHALLEGNEMPLQDKPRNALPRGSRPLPDRSTTTPEAKKLDRFEIFKNPPSQSRNAAYTANPNASPPVIEVIPEVDTPPTQPGIEKRSDDIRAATSMRLKDRSPKLPTPTAVTDRPGRPIVSFDPAWKPVGDSPEARQAVERKPVRPNPTIPAMTVSAPAVPTICFPDDHSPPVPTIDLPEHDVPTIPSISLPDDSPAPAISISAPNANPNIKTPVEPRPRPLPRPTKSSPSKLPPAKTRLPWLNPSSRAGVPTATCANCSLPISGRIVTASGASKDTSKLKAMFHPECFTCHQCSTALECVAFYPEPETKRHERLEAEGIPSDSDVDIRFFCHLDFHEFFSPRCKSCKTPIEGEIIVAVGAEWHVGHFFCGECGDPFDSKTPFVERDGYAYCVRCHTRRTSARCRACKTQILEEMTVEALGGKWHEKCFVCFECDGGFGDEGRFFVRLVEVEATEKEKRRGLDNKIEERAVCQGCEERRLKA